MTAQVLRRKFMRRFMGMGKYSRAVAWAVMVSYVGQAAFGVWAGHHLLGFTPTIWTVLAMVFLAIFIGSRLRGLNNIIHECSHSTFSAKREDNVIIGSLCASLVLRCFQDYRDDHLAHHAHLGDYEHDSEFKAIKNLRLDEPLTRTAFLRHMINPFLGRHLPYYLNANLSDRDGAFFKWFRILLLVSVGIFTLLEPLTGLMFVIIPYVLVYTAMNYWTDCLDHAGLVGMDDELDASRNVLAPIPLRLLFFPRNDCFHLVHHLFPQVPARHLKTTHEALCEDESYLRKQNATCPALVLSWPQSDEGRVPQDIS